MALKFLILSDSQLTSTGGHLEATFNTDPSWLTTTPSTTDVTVTNNPTAGFVTGNGANPSDVSHLWGIDGAVVQLLRHLDSIGITSEDNVNYGEGGSGWSSARIRGQAIRDTLINIHYFDYVIIGTGTNPADTKQDDSPNSADPYPTTLITELIDLAFEFNPKGVFLWTTPPKNNNPTYDPLRNGNDTSWRDYVEGVGAFEESFQDTYKRLTVFDAYNVMGGRTLNPSLWADTTHMNNAGHTLIADNSLIPDFLAYQDKYAATVGANGVYGFKPTVLRDVVVMGVLENAINFQVGQVVTANSIHQSLIADGKTRINAINASVQVINGATGDFKLYLYKQTGHGSEPDTEPTTQLIASTTFTVTQDLTNFSHIRYAIPGGYLPAAGEVVVAAVENASGSIQVIQITGVPDAGNWRNTGGADASWGTTGVSDFTSRFEYGTWFEKEEAGMATDDIKTAKFQVAMNGSLGDGLNQSYTKAGISWTPKAAYIIVSQGSVDATAAAGMSMCGGISDGTTQAVMGTSSEDDVASTNVFRYSASDRVIALLDPTDNTHATRSSEWEFNAFVPGGVSLTQRATGGINAIATIILFGGADLEVEALILDLGNVQTAITHTTSFEPTFILPISNGSNVDNSGAVDNLGIGLGAVTNDGAGTIVQMTLGSSGSNGSGAGSAAQRVQTDNASMQVNSNNGNATSLTAFSNFTSVSFDTTSNFNMGNDDLLVLAMRTGDAQTWAGQINTPTAGEITADGGWLITDPGFKPQLFGLNTSMATATNTPDISATAGTFGFSVFEDGESVSVQIRTEVGATQIVSESLSTDDAFFLTDDDGVTTFNATNPQMQPTGALIATADITLMDATPRRLTGWAIESIVSLGPPTLTAEYNDQFNDVGDTPSVDISTNIAGGTSFSAEGLPPSLSINASTGVITGTLGQDGNFPVTINAQNSIGVLLPPAQFRWYVGAQAGMFEKLEQVGSNGFMYAYNEQGRTIAQMNAAFFSNRYVVSVLKTDDYLQVTGSDGTKIYQVTVTPETRTVALTLSLTFA